MSINDYKILGLDITSTDDMVKKKYKKLALKYHPDKNTSDDASEKFAKISQAYENIINKNTNINNINRENVFNVNINSNELFNQLFKNMNISEMSEMSNVFVSPLPTKTTFTSTTVQIVNGKKIQTVREKKNGVTRTKTIISDI